ncbi:GNAT family N-acetyltransferase [Radiobacillus kanasensis]|uniref:GNAT family N-acetyltransferase n=1 Tax=Radiobacillus kanasensis TaxID=2844358 RepID=UPI001E4B1698|nr:GNAT family protein [Radiobacillus kanasensis]UFT98178.1 GNAT family N-acetyltransferase [Radiobacillus kanasensis]
MFFQEGELVIRSIEEKDLSELWELIYKEEYPEWKKWDAPYFKHEPLSYDNFLAFKDQYVGLDSRFALQVGEQIIGTCGYYWEHEPSRWLEMGIVIYRPEFWSGGYGTKAFRFLIGHLFETLPIARVGFTTWSGNHRMMKVGEKLGMTLEARLRKCRYYNGVYYDSIRYGLLREEWEQREVKEFI